MTSPRARGPGRESKPTRLARRPRGGSGPSHTSLLLGVGLFALALTVRLFYLYESSDNPTFATPVADAQNYDLLARALVDGKGMDAGFFWQSVFYPSFLALIYFLSGSSMILVKVLGVLLGSVTCVLTYHLGRMVFDRRTGIVAGLIVALYGPLIYYEAELFATGWAVFWALVLLLLFLKARFPMGLGFYLGLGSCGALAVLTRPTFLPFFAAGSLWLAIILYRRDTGVRRLAYRLLMIAAGYLAIATPVALQNLRVTGHFGIMPANGGVNLYMGNNPNAAVTEATRPGLEYERLRALAREEGAGDQWAEADFFYRKTAEYALTQPLDFGRGLLRKATHFISSREIPGDEDVYLFRRWSGLLRLLTWKLGGFGFPFGLLLVFGVFGWLASRRRVPLPLVLFLLIYSASIILTHVRGRYRLAIVPPLAVLAVAGVFAGVESARARRWGRLALGSCGAVALILLSSWPGPFRMETRGFEPAMYWRLAEYERRQSGRTEKAITYYREALRLDPDFLEAHTQLAHTLLATGRLEEALTHYREVIRLEPDFAGGHNNLAHALVTGGRIDEALAHCAARVSLHPASAVARGGLAAVLHAAGRTGEAVPHYREAIRIEPDDAKTHYGLAVALYSQGDVGEAVKEYQETVRLDPRHADAYYNLGALLGRQNRLEEAVPAYRHALQINPRHFGARYNLGNAFRRLGKFKQAAEEYRLALRIDPSYADARYNLGLVLVRQGERDRAVVEFREALRLDPDHVLARQALESTPSRRGR